MSESIMTPKLPDMKLPTFEGKMADSLSGIHPTDNHALEQVIGAIHKRYDWDEKRGVYIGLIETIQDDFKRILASPTPEEASVSYAKIKGSVDRLPEESGLRKKVSEIVHIPEIESPIAR